MYLITLSVWYVIKRYIDTSRNVRKRTLFYVRPMKTHQPAYPRSLIRIFVVREKLCIISYPRRVKIPIRLQSDRNLRWVHMSKGTFSDVPAHVVIFRTYFNRIVCSLILCKQQAKHYYCVCLVPFYFL